MTKVTARQRELAKQVNIIAESDSYKYSHDKQTPPGAEYTSGYVEARGVAKDRNWTHVVPFGTQAILTHFAENPATLDNVEEMEDILGPHGVPFNKQGWLGIVRDYGGHLPLEISTIDEGFVVPMRTPIAQVVNTDPRYHWLPCFIETPFQRGLWYPSTVATQSFHLRRIISAALLKTGTPPENVAAMSQFMMQDFGARGTSSNESAGIGGGAALTSFRGTDTIEALRWHRRNYDCPMAGYSVPASEHSTMTAWGPGQGEIDAYRNMLRQYAKPGAIISVVSDGYDIFNACRNIWGGVLKDEVNALAAIGAKLVIRPDSGDPTTVLINILSILTECFGYTVTRTGHKLLPAHVRVLQGDGIAEQTLPALLNAIADAGFSIENFACLGSGGANIQKVDRDTMKFAMKSSAICINGEWRDVYKDPITDPGKVSKKGRQSVFVRDGVVVSERLTPENAGKSLLIPRYRNGELLNLTDLDAVRERIETIV